MHPGKHLCETIYGRGCAKKSNYVDGYTLFKVNDRCRNRIIWFLCRHGSQQYGKMPFDGQHVSYSAEAIRDDSGCQVYDRQGRVKCFGIFIDANENYEPGHRNYHVCNDNEQSISDDGSAESNHQDDYPRYNISPAFIKQEPASNYRKRNSSWCEGPVSKKKGPIKEYSYIENDDDSHSWTTDVPRLPQIASAVPILIPSRPTPLVQRNDDHRIELVSIPNELMGVAIGKQWRKFNRVERHSGVVLTSSCCPGNCSGSSHVSISGTSDSIIRAKNMIIQTIRKTEKYHNYMTNNKHND